MAWSVDTTAITADSTAATTDGATGGDTTAPSAPGTPTFSSVTSTGMTVSYTAATDNVAVTGYESNVNGAGWVDRGNVLTFNLSGLSGSTSYTVQVRAYDAAGNRGTASSASQTTLATVTITGGKSMQFVFGPGDLVVTPLTQADGTVITLPTPRRLGAFQEASFDSSADRKMLYGANSYPLAVGRGKAQVSLKVKAAQFSVDQWNAVFVGQNSNVTTGVVSAVADTQGATIPGTPFTITPTVPSSGTWSRDLGVTDGSGAALVRVASGPTAGQYSVTAGVYTFAAADTGKQVFISFAYTATSTTAKSLIVNNVPMGQAPFVQLDLLCNYGGNKLLVTLFQAIAAKASFGTKLDDFANAEFEFEGFVNSAGQAYQLSAAQ